MPVYTYVCSCGKIFEKFSSIANYQEKRKCECGKIANHSIALDHRYGNVDSQMKEYQFDGENGTRLYPCAVLPSQIEEAKRQHPTTDYIYHQGCYVPRIRNRTHRKRFLKEHGFIEFD